MRFNKIRMVSSLLLQLVSVHARAEGEGSGNPFPHSAPARVVAETHYAADGGQERHPDLAGRLAARPEAVSLLAASGSEAPFLSAGTAPAGFDRGTVAFTQARSLERYEASRRRPAQGSSVALAGK